MSKFVHLHLHTEYSLLDGLSKIKLLTNRVKELGMDSVAITDHGVMYGAIEFYKQCLKEDVKPIIGMEAYVMKGTDSHEDKDPKKKTNANHLLLLAQNLQGYKNLMELTSIAHLDGFYYRPRFDKKTLKKYSEGLICSSACPAGEIPEILLQSGYEKAKKAVEWYLDVFGDNYYLELQRHEHDVYIDKIEETDPQKVAKIKADLQRMNVAEKKINAGVVKLSREMGVPLIATNDVHYINQDDAEAQDALVCVATASHVAEVDRMRYKDVKTFYLRSPEEMQGLFPEYPEALSNTVEIAKKCDIEITLGKWFFPKLPDLPENKTETEILRERVAQMFSEKYPKMTDELQKRLDFELKVICDKGYAGYFLIMADFAEWSRKQRIVTNTRGSAAGSLVSYVLNITSVDPMRYLLPFERFLNPFRPSPPDIDLDIADNKRQMLIDYIVKKFGAEKVAQIGTFGRMMARGSVKDIARVLGYDYNTGDRLSKMIPMGAQGFPMTIERALAESSELRYAYDNDLDAKRIIDLAQKVEGSARHSSVHAAGVVVAPTKVTDFSPLQRENKGNKIITQYEMHAAEDVGLIKFDILGITFLSILDTALELVENTTGKRIDLSKIPLDDEKTFDMLARGETVGVFQMVSSGMTKWLMEMEPNKVEDLMAMVALYRPGPMANIQDYIDRKQGKQQVHYFHPKAKKFLQASYGILVYQDDLLYTAIELAGYNWKEVDKFRKAVGKKIPEEMAKQHVKFVKGCMEHSGMTKEEAEEVWKLFEPFQGYGFNKAHAASYGMISYYTAYMKAHYPVQYMTAMLTADAGDTEKMSLGIEACKQMGILVLPPDINESSLKFTVVDSPDSLDGKAIRFGLSGVKNVGGAAIDAIMQARMVDIEDSKKVKKFTSLTDFFDRVDTRKVNKRVLESLIKAGAFDAFGNRASLLAGMDNLRALSDQIKKRKASGQVGLFSDDSDDSDKTISTKSDLEDKVLKDKLPEVPDFLPEQKLAFEKELLGIYLTDNPYENKLAGLQAAITHRVTDLDPDLDVRKVVKLGGFVSDCRVVVTKKSNQKMAFCTLTDLSGKIDMVIFPRVYAETKNFWTNDQVVLVEGRVEYREDQLSIVVEKVMGVESENVTGASVSESEDLNTSDKLTKGGNVLIIPRGVDKNKLVAVNGLLKNNPGNDRVILLFENGASGGKRVQIPFGVDYSKKLQKKVVSLLMN